MRQHLGDDEEFLAGYADGLGDLPLDRHIAEFRARGATAGFVAVPSPQGFHTLHGDEDGLVTSFGDERGRPLLDQQQAGYCAARSSI